jgi:hypothetical protein
MMSAPHSSTVDREQIQILVGELRTSCSRFLSVLNDVPEVLRNLRASERAWSIMDCAEHVCRAEELMAISFEKRRPTNASPDLEKDAVIHQIVLDRSRKIVAPQRAQPTGRYRSLKEAADALLASRERTIALLESLGEDLRQSTCLHPLGIVDAHQFVRIMALHWERHADQIQEIKNSAAYRAALHTVEGRS